MPATSPTARAACFAMSFIAATPAAATGDISCNAADASGASITIGIGHLPVLAVLTAHATDGRNEWSTVKGGSAQAMMFGQGFADDRQILVDFTDANMQRVIVSLRLNQASVGSSSAEAGILVFADGPVVPVTCTNG